MDKAPLEMVSNKFCKYIGEHHVEHQTLLSKLNWDGSKFSSFICGQTFRYWPKLINYDSSRILKMAYESELEIHNARGTSWASFIAIPLESIGCERL